MEQTVTHEKKCTCNCKEEVLKIINDRILYGLLVFFIVAGTSFYGGKLFYSLTQHEEVTPETEMVCYDYPHYS
jgi:hypothetical protein